MKHARPDVVKRYREKDEEFKVPAENRIYCVRVDPGVFLLVILFLSTVFGAMRKEKKTVAQKENDQLTMAIEHSGLRSVDSQVRQGKQNSEM